MDREWLILRPTDHNDGSFDRLPYPHRRVCLPLESCAPLRLGSAWYLLREAGRVSLELSRVKGIGPTAAVDKRQGCKLRTPKLSNGLFDRPTSHCTSRN